MRRAWIIRSLCLSVVLVALVVAPSTASAVPVTPVPTTVVVDPFELSLVRQINTFRARRHLPLVRIDYKLQRASEWMSLDMQRTDSLDHIDGLRRQLVRRLAAFHYPVRLAAVGENVARGRIAPNQTLADWLRSPIHIAILKDRRWHAVGVGRNCVIRVDTTQDCWWTANFGARWTQAMPPRTPPVVSDPTS